MRDEVWFIEYRSMGNGPCWLRLPTGFPTKEEAEHAAADLRPTYKTRIVRP